MTAFNAQDYIKQAIGSIINQTETDWELIVVDDGSADNTFDILMDFRAHWKSEQNMRIISNKKNVGHTKSLNIALNDASGEIYARQDADDMSEPNRFEEQLKCIENGADIVTTHSVAIDKDGNRIPDWYCDKAQRRTELEIKIHSEVDWWCCGPSTMFKKGVVDAIGGFDEECFYAQDFNFWLRAVEHFGWKVCEMELYRLRRHKSARSNPKAKERNWHQWARERARLCPIIS